MTAPTSISFGELSDVSSMVITDNMDEEFSRVDDPRRIADLATWLAARQDGWYVPSRGVQVAPVRVNFYAGRQARGHVGAAARVMTAHHRGDFAQRDWTTRERVELFQILGVSDPPTGGR